jgi:hypothetical protein
MICLEKFKDGYEWDLVQVVTKKSHMFCFDAKQDGTVACMCYSHSGGFPFQSARIWSLVVFFCFSRQDDTLKYATTFSCIPPDALFCSLSLDAT